MEPTTPQPQATRLSPIIIDPSDSSTSSTAFFRPLSEIDEDESLCDDSVALSSIATTGSRPHHGPFVSNHKQGPESPTTAHNTLYATVVASTPLTTTCFGLPIAKAAYVAATTPPRSNTTQRRNGSQPTTTTRRMQMPPPTTTMTAAPQKIPWVSLSEGITKKASPGLQSWSQLVLTLDGRDKFTKLLQYTCRLLAWWCAGDQRKRRWTNLKSTLTHSRKAFRLGRSFMELEKLRQLGVLEWWLRTHSQKDEPAWKMIGTALKMLGLLGFWTFDNCSFLALSGVLDDFSLRDKQRWTQRQHLVSRASVLANRFYFAGALAGLVTNYKTYWEHHHGELRQLEEQASSLQPPQQTEDLSDPMFVELKKARERQFALCLALLKSCCDVLVFSNNAGIDVWKKYRGKKMHEGFHCVCGLLSASTVLYNNYPAAASS